MEKDIFKRGFNHIIYMADHTQNRLYGPALARQVAMAEGHYSSKNVKARHVFPHCKAGIIEGIRGSLINPQANRRTDPFSCDIVDLVGYHLFLEPDQLPACVQRRIRNPFLLFNQMRRLMYSKDSTKEDFAGLVGSKSIPRRDRLLMLYAHICDAMTVHDQATVDAVPYGGLRSVNNGGSVLYPKYEDWEAEVAIIARPIRKVLCSAADRFGLSYAYRKLRDIAASYLYPAIFEEVNADLVHLRSNILKTNQLVGEIAGRVLDECEDKGLKIQILSRNMDPDRSHAEGEEECKTAGSITDKIAKKRAEGEVCTVRTVHDVVARMIITQDMESLRIVLGILKKAIISTLKAHGMQVQVAPPDTAEPDGTLAIFEPTNYIDDPKPNGYRSYHIDVLISELMQYLNFEFIVRTKEMHEFNDRGGAAHNAYKESDLSNEDLDPLVELADEIRRNGNGKILQTH